jgi:hypothetical protein
VDALFVLRYGAGKSLFASSHERISHALAAHDVAFYVPAQSISSRSIEAPRSSAQIYPRRAHAV